MSGTYKPHSADQIVCQIAGMGIMQVVASGAPPASAPGYGTGCIYQRSDNGLIYTNTGTNLSATWTTVTTS